jgi:hypothetical protein
LKEHLFFMAALAGCVVFLAAVITEAGRNLTTPSGLKVDILQEGNGPVPQKGQTVVVHYTGTLENGKKFDSSRDRGEPFSFVLGAGKVIRGWDEGLALMNVGRLFPINGFPRNSFDTSELAHREGIPSVVFRQGPRDFRKEY